MISSSTSICWKMSKIKFFSKLKQDQIKMKIIGFLKLKTGLLTFLAVDPASSSSTVFLGQKIKINVRRTSRKNIPTTAFLQKINI